VPPDKMHVQDMAYKDPQRVGQILVPKLGKLVGTARHEVAPKGGKFGVPDRAAVSLDGLEALGGGGAPQVDGSVQVG